MMEKRQRDGNSFMTWEAGESLPNDLLLFTFFFNLLLLEEQYSQVLSQCFHSSSPQAVIVHGSIVLTNGAERIRQSDIMRMTQISHKRKSTV